MKGLGTEDARIKQMDQELEDLLEFHRRGQEGCRR